MVRALASTRNENFFPVERIHARLSVCPSQQELGILGTSSYVRTYVLMDRDNNDLALCILNPMDHGSMDHHHAGPWFASP